MLRLVVQEEELFDETTSKFSIGSGFVLELEHSLFSLSKWESEYQKSFLSHPDKTRSETIGYIRCMVNSPTFSPEHLSRLTQSHLDQINEYIESKQSATTFGHLPERKGRNEVITSELIYYWMVAFNIPFECEHWHLNRLFALIRICNIKQSKGKRKKMPRHEFAARQRELNEQRRAQLGTTG